MNIEDRKEINRWLSKALAYSDCGKPKMANECADILNRKLAAQGIGSQPEELTTGRAMVRVSELESAIADMRAFIEWALANNAERLIAGTIGHDLAGLLANDPCFSPRSHGYAAKLQPATA